MSALKSYSCSKCGAALVFEASQEILECPFCGTGFGSADFHGDELLDQAKSSLEQKAYAQAKEKCNAVLKVDPHCFDALLGLVLCEMGVPSVDSLENPNNIKNAKSPGIKTAIERARDNSGLRGAAYIDQIAELVLNAGKIKEAEASNSEVNDMDAKKVLKSASEENRYNKVPIVLHIVMAILFLASFVPIILQAWDKSKESFGAVVQVVGLFAVLAAAAIVIEIFLILSAAKPKKHLANLYEKERFVMESELQDLRDEYKKQYSKLQSLKFGIKNEFTTVEAEDEAEDYSSYNDAGKTIQCAKCGAALALDRSKRVYQCNSCGVAYGVSLFFGQPLERALDAVNSGYFEEADSRMSHVLMEDHSNPDALLGRILCCGRWTRISDIGNSNYISPTRIKMLHILAKEAGDRASESDREFFATMDELVDALNDVMTVRYKLDANRNAMHKLDMRLKIYGDGYALVYSDPDFARKELEEEKRTLEIEEPRVQHALAELKDKLIDMRSGSVFCK